MSTPRSERRRALRAWRWWAARDEDTRITAAPRAGLATLTQPPRPWTFDDLIKPASRRATEH